MASFNGYGSTVAIDFRNGGYWGLPTTVTNAGTPYQSANVYEEYLSNGYTGNFFGNGFTYADLNSRPTGGTITAIQVLDASNNFIYSIYDIAFTAASLDSIMHSGGNWGSVLTTLLAGDDDIWGGSGNDVLSGYAGNDYLDGDAGHDSLSGGTGNDDLFGGTGNDTLDGGAGINYLSGDGGNDFYAIRNRTDQVIDSSGTDGGIIYVDFYKASSSVENWTWADGVQKLPYWIDGLLSDDAPTALSLLGSAKTFTYNFPTTIPTYFDSTDSYNFQAFNESQKAFVRQALSYISTLIDVTFVESSDPYTANSLTFTNNYQSGSAGYAYLPSPAEWGSDVFLDYSSGSETNLSPVEGDYSALVFIHEIGHALGLKHPFDDTPNLPAGEDDSQWTVMSYNSHPADYFLRYSPLDIAALQYLYGPSTLQINSNTYTLSSAAPNFIWDGGGTDTIDGSALTGALTLYLEAGRWSHIGAKSNLISAPGQITINIGTVIENATGGKGNDTITGNTSSNKLIGGAGSDILSGGAGADILNGVGGVDTADYTNDVDVNGNGLGIVVNLSATALAAGAWQGDAYTSLAAGKARDGWGALDTLIGMERVRGSAFNDVIVGGAANEMLTGASGSDSLNGGDGNDTLAGGAANDRMTGGAGSDIFKFVAYAQGNDTLTDFTTGVDKLQVVAANFGLIAGAAVTLHSASATPTTVGTSAQFLYNTTTGALFFDRDGTGTTYAATRIATLSGPKTLAASDIQVVAA